MNRRTFVVGVAFASVAWSCKREARCSTCGMRIDPASAFRAELVTDLSQKSPLVFDTPRCALRAWKKAGSGVVRLQEYYDRTLRDARELRLVTGSDVAGPMGPDFIPVDPSHVAKFMQDHSGDHAYRLEEITVELL